MIKIPTKAHAVLIPVIVVTMATAIVLYYLEINPSKSLNFKDGPVVFSKPTEPARLPQERAIFLAKKYLGDLQKEQTQKRRTSVNHTLTFDISNAKVIDTQYRLLTSSLHPPGVTIKNIPCYVISFGNITDQDYVNNHYQTYNRFNVLVNANTGSLIAGFAYNPKITSSKTR